MPTERMVLQSYIKTTGIVEVERTFLGQCFKFIDVGGQRNERKKWVHVLDTSHAVIYPVSLSEYNTVCYEDDSTNRTHESLALFREIVNSDTFSGKPFYLIFTKDDVFLDKIQYFDLTAAFDSEDLPRDLLLNRPILNHAVEYRQRKSFPRNQSSLVQEPGTETDTQMVENGVTDTIEITVDPGEEGIEDSSTLSSSSSQPSSNNGEINGQQLAEMLTAYRTRASEIWRCHQRNKEEQLELLQLEQAISRSRAASRATTSPRSVGPPSLEEEMEKKKEEEEEDKEEIATLADVPVEVLQLMCLYLEPLDLCRLQMVNYDMYRVSGSDFVWKFICLSYIERPENIRINEHQIDQLYTEYRIKMQEKQHLTAMELDSEKELIMQKWKCLYDKGGYLAQRSRNHIIDTFLEQIEDEERRAQISAHVYVTSPIDTPRFKQVLREICEDLIARRNCRHAANVTT